ncbi:Toll-like receptor 1 [Stylophora pistillata]|uniref:Toll-like receptor 1 n=1 Tax=Stylophora pistillata TaxID=50429 RepID=A0A2B4RUN0_STYPI|nr:Toll-like receptor 1 [Stylophora pistillata]
MGSFPVKRFILCGAVIGTICSALQQGEILCNIRKQAFFGREVTVNLQDTVLLNCSVLRGGPMRQITWSKEDNGSKLQWVSILPSESVPGFWSSVQISNISAKDHGTYKCELPKDNGTSICSVVLHVNSPPHFMKRRGFFTTTPQYLSEGQDPVFHCYARGWPKPSFTWLKDEVVIKDGDGNHSYALTTRNSGLDLKIFYVRQKNHEGRYTCVAKNKFGEKRHEVNLSVKNEKKSIKKGENHYKSEHVESFSYHEGILRGEVQASMKKKVYKVTGIYLLSRTEVECQWRKRKSHTSLSNQAVSELFPPPKRYCALSRAPTQADRSAFYEDLKNYGNFTGVCWLLSPEPPVASSENVPPKVHPYASIDKVIIQKSGNALLTCVGENTPNSITFISWAFEGKDLPLDGNHRLHHESNFFFDEQSIPKVNFSLLIKNVTEQDTGAYQCKVRTLRGSDYGTIYLSVVESNETTLKEFQYDVFISFSTLDYYWVRDNLTPVLESKRINYCIHSRDFIVGKAIIENMADSVYNSRKVLAIISRNYLDSNFCREELEIAMHRSAEMADSSLLLIRLDNVDTKNLPKTLRRRTFLDYSSNLERVDWEERLLKQIEFDAKGFHRKVTSNLSTDMVQLISHL